MNAGERGFGMIEILLVSVLIGVVSVGISSMMSSMQADQNGLKWRMDADNLTEEMRALLSSSASCTNTFGGLMAQSGASYDLPSLRDGAGSPGQPQFVVGTTYGDRSVNLVKLTLASFKPGIDATRAQMTLTAGLQPARRSSGAQYIIREINVSLEINAFKFITSCLAAAKMSDGLWQRVPSNLSSIFYDTQVFGGMVGINTNTPLSTLDVAGPVRVTTTAHRNMPMSLNPNTEGLGGGFHQGVGFNLEFNRPAGVWQIGGDGVSSGAGAVLIDHADGAMRFLTIPSVAGSGGYTVATPTLLANERMRLDAAGRLGIGTMNPQYQLHLTADSAAKPGTGAWTIASDRRLKTLGPRFRRGLSALEKLEPRYFSYKPANALGLPSDRRYVGVTAQEVQGAVPEAVSRDERGYLHVTNDPIVWTMLNAIRELSTEQRELRNEIDALEAGAR